MVDEKVVKVRSKGAQISIALVCLMLGIMMSVQYKTTTYYNATMVPERAEDLASQINTVTKEKKALEQKAESLSEQLKNVKNNEQALQDLKKELQNAKQAVGMVPLEGPGIEIILNDNPNSLEPGANPNSYLIHDEDLLLVVNDLKVAGAEAISINDQRITAMSEIRCAGTLILINQVSIGPPFVIRAIGNPDELYGAMSSKSGSLDLLSISGLKTSMERLDSVNIPASKTLPTESLSNKKP